MMTWDDLTIHVGIRFCIKGKFSIEFTNGYLIAIYYYPGQLIKLFSFINKFTNSMYTSMQVYWPPVSYYLNTFFCTTSDITVVQA